VNFPGAMIQQRGNLRRSEFLRQIAEIDGAALELAEGISRRSPSCLPRAPAAPTWRGKSMETIARP